MRKRFTLKTLVASFIIAMCAPLYIFADVEINETNFPDANFRSWLLEQDYGQDGVITDEEIEKINRIYVSSNNISSLKGIEYFTKIGVLYCNNNQLTTLDVSRNTELVVFSCSDNQLTTLDMSKNAELYMFFCDNNQLTTLDVSKNAELGMFSCSNNQLTTLDVSNNAALEYFTCENNKLATLDVSNHTALKELRCNNNQLTSLNVSHNTALTYLQCSDNQLANLDVSGCTALRDWYCYNNKINGANMDYLISSLPNKNGCIYIYDSISETEENVCTKSQVAAIKEKGWFPCYYNGEEWLEYEGVDVPTGINANEANNGADLDTNAVAYDLNGNRVEDWQSKKGVYIVNSKKVVVK